MYPLVTMAAVGFATEKMYNEPEDAFGWIQLILLIIDVIELVWTQTVRLKMTYKVSVKIAEPQKQKVFIGLFCVNVVFSHAPHALHLLYMIHSPSFSHLFNFTDHELLIQTRDSCLVTNEPFLCRL